MNRLHRAAQRRRGGRSAFTLIELLLVLVILAILTSVVAVHIAGTTQKAKVSAAKSTIDALKGALKTFEIDNERFPTSEEGLNALTTNPGNLPDWKHPYIDKLLMDPWGHPYNYESPGKDGADFEVYSSGPDGQPGTSDDVN
jgi:general secretion pathway protein G